MLIMRRKEGAEIVIRTPEDIEVRIVVTDVSGHMVCLGIEAPRDWRIDWAENLRQPTRKEPTQ